MPDELEEPRRAGYRLDDGAPRDLIRRKGELQSHRALSSLIGFQASLRQWRNDRDWPLARLRPRSNGVAWLRLWIAR